MGKSTPDAGRERCCQPGCPGLEAVWTRVRTGPGSPPRSLCLRGRVQGQQPSAGPHGKQLFLDVSTPTKKHRCPLRVAQRLLT